MTDRAMREPTLPLPTALADEPRHGYTIARGAEALSGERVRLRADTRYRALERSSQQRLIRAHSEEVAEGRPRRSHALTSRGCRALAAAATQTTATTRAAASRRGTDSGGVARAVAA
ncbi:PadR family transcriptional regulator [Streptomyces sp. NPDC048111]|uniref:PadR family transcriptional regulator n=1 Tax=Streptomyces sp. NPDC048111 TaxID=3365500 RepID=UPI003712FDFE